MNNTVTFFRRRHRRAQRGMSLIELMVSLLIGMVIVGAVLSAYVGSGTSSRNTQAMAQITEDASVALNVLRTHVAMAGYSRPVGFNGLTNSFVKAQTEPALFGCDSDFDDLSADIGILDCGAGGTDSDVIAVAYEADLSNSIANSDGTEPLDCLGNSLEDTKKGVAPNDYWLSYSRFYVGQPEGATAKGLYCRGPGAEGAQALVENVERLEISYGVAEAGGTRVVRYADAADLTRAEFERVVSVRLCVVVASANPVMDEETAYQGCDPFSDPTEPAEGDRRMFKAFTSTIVLHNRLKASS